MIHPRTEGMAPLMTSRRRGELLCGIGACAWGLLLLLVAYLQPYGESNATAVNVLKLHPGFTAIEAPYIVAIGLPILGVIVGAITHSLTASRDARLLLWIATIILGIEVLFGSISILGVLPVPSFLLGLWASLLARHTQQGTPDAVSRAA
jgi:hypothetical protein